MIIRNARVLSEDGGFKQGDIFIEGGRFSEAPSGGETLNAGGCYALPGLIDIHFHGAAGYDFCDGTPEALRAISAYEASQGVTAICPATVTQPEDALIRACENARALKGKLEGAELVGINLEGPFINKEKKGAQNPDYIRDPDIAMFERLQAASGGLIKLCDLAPELEGAMDFIRRFKDELVISLAHTSANYETARAACEAGASHLTHLFNAMPPLLHRDPGVIGAASEANCEAELIADGIHVHPSAVRAALRLFGEDKVIFISDSMRAVGLPDGDYTLGGLAVKVKGRLATLEDGTIAGSATPLLGCLQTAVRDMGIPLETAARCASENPARCIGVFEERGSISVGKAADLILLDENLELKNVILKGRVYC
ncbi:MAG: N-acetylglucosamine-6-phosphate deacetylase [Oscillospiraceae bacterium]|nr:N-acetylglucosamine-6-phosphate deacetylase [Oscillospiraceae bacterium]